MVSSKTIGELALIRLMTTVLLSTNSCAEQDAAHLDRVLGAFRRRHRPHEGLVGIAHVGKHHVEMALVDRHVDRLAHRAARMVDRRRHIGELHEIAEILQRRIAAVAVEIAHEGRAVDRREDRVVAADLDRFGRIARMLGELGRRGLQQFAAQPLGKMHPLALDVGTGLLPHAERFGVVAELDADFLQHAVGIGLDQRQALLVEHLVGLDGAGGYRSATRRAATTRAPRAVPPRLPPIRVRAVRRLPAVRLPLSRPSAHSLNRRARSAGIRQIVAELAKRLANASPCRKIDTETRCYWPVAFRFGPRRIPAMPQAGAGL
jgi:hypothetical protein